MLTKGELQASYNKDYFNEEEVFSRFKQETSLYDSNRYYTIILVDGFYQVIKLPQVINHVYL